MKPTLIITVLVFLSGCSNPTKRDTLYITSTNKQYSPPNQTKRNVKTNFEIEMKENGQLNLTTEEIENKHTQVDWYPEYSSTGVTFKHTDDNGWVRDYTPEQRKGFKNSDYDKKSGNLFGF